MRKFYSTHARGMVSHVLTLGVILLFSLPVSANAKRVESRLDSVQNAKKENRKKGWSFGALPVISYNSDLGFQYGGLATIYNFGDGSNYPKYNDSFYVEWSMFTGGSMISHVYWENLTLVKKWRFMVDAVYLLDPLHPFYGFNGAQTSFNLGYMDPEAKPFESVGYYAIRQDQARLRLDALVELPWKNFYAGMNLGFQYFWIDEINAEKLGRKGKEKRFPKNGRTLYSDMRKDGAITDAEAHSGFVFSIQGGLRYDSRDIEANPNQGILANLTLQYVPPFGAIPQKYQFLKAQISFSQFVPIVKGRLTFAYRLMVQQIVAGEAPFYLLPEVLTLYKASDNNEGLGGKRTLRGVYANRVVGRGFGLANLELRYRFYDFRLLKQNFYLAALAFTDVGMVYDTRSWNNAQYNSAYRTGATSDHLHMGFGGGGQIGMNENFILNLTLGYPLRKVDGRLSVYLGIGYIF